MTPSRKFYPAPSKSFLESTGAFSSDPPPSEGRSILTHSAPGAGRGAAFEALTVPTPSRRSVVATMIAAFAPAAGTAGTLPKVVEVASAIAAPAAIAPPAPTGESPELLALGAELDVKLEAYRAAAARLAEARATAAGLWPEVPPEILSPSKRADRHFADHCYDREVDFEGKDVWPEPYVKDGKTWEGPPRMLLQPAPLRQYLDEVRADPECYEEGFAEEVAERLEAVQRYEAACTHAIEASNIVEVKERAVDCAQDLHSLLFRVREHVPRSVAGVLIMARAVMAYEEAQKDSYTGGERGGGLILGRELADAVLRLAGIAA